mmetsp:Transcript_11271/g.35814  ORF Transcript_11271/g.35814 Transcript_11271/m.35814 type:complete len:292 (-) Transcript_11271:558-1433(-)
MGTVEVVSELVRKDQPVLCLVKLVHTRVVAVRATDGANPRPSNGAVARAATGEEVRGTHAPGNVRSCLPLEVTQLEYRAASHGIGGRAGAALVDLLMAYGQLDMHLVLVDEGRLHEHGLDLRHRLAAMLLEAVVVHDHTNLELMQFRVAGVAPRPPLCAAPCGLPGEQRLLARIGTHVGDVVDAVGAVVAAIVHALAVHHHAGLLCPRRLLLWQRCCRALCSIARWARKKPGHIETADKVRVLNPRSRGGLEKRSVVLPALLAQGLEAHNALVGLEEAGDGPVLLNHSRSP